jgi:hypothetical protein
MSVSLRRGCRAGAAWGSAGEELLGLRVGKPTLYLQNSFCHLPDRFVPPELSLAEAAGGIRREYRTSKIHFKARVFAFWRALVGRDAW